jgi:hypothetical protein
MTCLPIFPVGVQEESYGYARASATVIAWPDYLA